MLKHFVIITPETVKLNGVDMSHAEQGNALLTELYRAHVGDYPKFFKMDTLSKLGFVASEMLLKDEGEERFVPREDRAVELFNRTASLQADTNYQATIQDPENFFPSPAAFVYTLPNIVTGEIAIRNKYYGETSFIVMESCDAQIMARQLMNAFQDPMTQSILGGWLDCTDENHFEARLFLVEKQQFNNIESLETELLNSLDISTIQRLNKQQLNNNKMDELIYTLKQQIIEALNLEDMTPEDIDENASLFGEGLGLDSIDALELIVLMEKNYGIKLQDPSMGKEIFKSVAVMADYIQKNRTK
jgi:3-oxoacyl-[acyl-carrier-protein] synthase-1